MTDITYDETNEVDSRRRSKHWVFTWNNYTDAEWGMVTIVDSVYLVAGKEIGKKGTPHIQGYIVMTQQKSLKQMKGLFTDKVWWCQAKGTAAQNRKYCTKQNEYVETGIQPNEPGRKGGEVESEKWVKALELARAGLPQEDPRIEFYGQKVCDAHRRKFLLQQPLEHTFEQMFWFHGKTGTGKSRKAETDWPGAYWKLSNKWWDNYMMEETVVVDEVSDEHKYMGYFLKMWADHRPFQAEIKGGQIRIRPRRIIVTSNWTPREIWPDEQTWGPLERRFKLVEFKG